MEAPGPLHWMTAFLIFLERTGSSFGHQNTNSHTPAYLGANAYHIILDTVILITKPWRSETISFISTASAWHRTLAYNRHSVTNADGMHEVGTLKRQAKDLSLGLILSWRYSLMCSFSQQTWLQVCALSPFTNF